MNNPFLQTDTNSTQLQGLTLSQSATQQLNTLFSTEETNTVFRVRVLGGGCSGFQYTFDMDTQTKADDFVITTPNFTVACDTISLGYIDGGVIDFVNSLAGQYFTIINPNATASCGCGTSFSV